MKSFAHFDANSIQDACAILDDYKGGARLNAGGSDLLSILKGDLLPEYPEAIVNIKTIPGLDNIKEEDGFLKLGALVRLDDLIRSPLLNKKYRVLVEAALTVATPLVRNVATIGGNLCQDTRCWYYRYPESIGGPLLCLRKGGDRCLAVRGDNRYHAIIGGKKCFAVCPSDMAVALAALDGRLNISGPKGERNMAMADFFHPLGNNLSFNEIIREIEIPICNYPSQQNFLKFTLRKPVDFAIVSVASAIRIENKVCADARLILGAVAPFPLKAEKAEQYLLGKAITEEVAEAAAEKSLTDSKPLSGNAHKVQIAKTLVKRAILGSVE